MSHHNFIINHIIHQIITVTLTLHHNVTTTYLKYGLYILLILMSLNNDISIVLYDMLKGPKIELRRH